MFKRASLSPPRKPLPRDLLLMKKKGKKSDTKRSKRGIKSKASSECFEEHITEPSLENFTEETKTDSEDHSSSADDAFHNTACDSLTSKHTSASNGVVTTNLSQEGCCEENAPSPDLPENLCNVSNIHNEGAEGTSESSQVTDVISDALMAPALIEPTSSVRSTSLKTKRPKRRVVKRPSNSVDISVNSPSTLQPPNLSHVFEPVKAFVNSSVTQSITYNPNYSLEGKRLVNSRPQIVKLTEQLTVSERKIEELLMKTSMLSQENVHLRQKDEENALGLHVLQQQYTELLRTNKKMDHEKYLNEVKLKNLEAENANLRIHLDQSNTELTRMKDEAGLETRVLRDKLTEVQAKLSMISSSPPTPNPELVRTQELAQHMSNENRLLKSTLEQMKSELAQLRQTSRMQQQESQVLRLENHKLREAQDTAIGELRMKHNTEVTEASARIAAFETQLKRECQEYEAKKQEFELELSETRAKLALQKEHEKRLSEMISSLEYQFSELSAEKQQLMENLNAAKIAGESSTSELLIQVVRLTNDLTRTTTELETARQRADSATNELEYLKTAASKVIGIDVGIDALQPASNIEVWGFSPPATGTMSELRQLQFELETTKQQLARAMDDVIFAQKQEELANTELECHKATLLHTEKLLAQLRDVAEASENQWLRMLADSSSEREKLLIQLEEARSHKAPKDTQLGAHVLSSVQTQTVRSCPFTDTSPKTKNASSLNLCLENGNTFSCETTIPERPCSNTNDQHRETDLLDFVNIETTYDMDTVLVDDINFRTTDSKQGTATFSQNPMHTLTEGFRAE
ncbi:unnamed protein product [Dicrocoelium dendriticum]|nr:unnamed protein product [Dicrocoelium dendriticum]